ncbi:MAG: N-acetylmuramoyl-L-alanine amidase [Streptosporangiaceae bacterium]|jgi:N-acetylmuramoyl-L-alanine amidase
MESDRRARRTGRRRVLAWLVVAGLILALVAAADAAAAITGRLASAGKSAAPAARGRLAGRVIGIDPGHNGLNYTNPAFLNRKVWNGREWEGCDTTGTRTAGGYTEALFTWNVATYLRADLVAMGARVVMTRSGNRGLGPCVDRRARILNQAHANVSVDIHADYGPPAGRGFSILEPVADGPNNKVIGSSARFGRDVHAMLLRDTKLPVSDYYGRNGYISRDDLAGLNLTTMAKILVECGNMHNVTDAALLVRPGVQRGIAAALAAAIVKFLAAR